MFDLKQKSNLLYDVAHFHSHVYYPKLEDLPLVCLQRQPDRKQATNLETVPFFFSPFEAVTFVYFT